MLQYPTQTFSPTKHSLKLERYTQQTLYYTPFVLRRHPNSFLHPLFLGISRKISIIGYCWSSSKFRQFDFDVIAGLALNDSLYWHRTFLSLHFGVTKKSMSFMFLCGLATEEVGLSLYALALRSLFLSLAPRWLAARSDQFRTGSAPLFLFASREKIACFALGPQ